MNKLLYTLLLFIIFSLNTKAYSEPWRADVMDTPYTRTVSVTPFPLPHPDNFGFSQLSTKGAPKIPSFSSHESQIKEFYNLSMQLPSHALSNVPALFRTELRQEGIKDADVKIFAVGQVNPLNRFFDPELGIEPNAPKNGEFTKERKVDLKLIADPLTGLASQGVEFDAFDSNEDKQIQNVEVRNTGVRTVLQSSFKGKDLAVGPNENGQVVVKSKPIRVRGLSGGDCLWSLITYQDGPVKKALITRHLIWNTLALDAFNKLPLGAKQFASSQDVINFLTPLMPDPCHASALKGLLAEKPRFSPKTSTSSTAENKKTSRFKTAKNLRKNERKSKRHKIKKQKLKKNRHKVKGKELRVKKSRHRAKAKEKKYKKSRHKVKKRNVKMKRGKRAHVKRIKVKDLARHKKERKRKRNRTR